jgi:hypothetical protein
MAIGPSGNPRIGSGRCFGRGRRGGLGSARTGFGMGGSMRRIMASVFFHQRLSDGVAAKNIGSAAFGRVSIQWPPGRNVAVQPSRSAARINSETFTNGPYVVVPVCGLAPYVAFIGHST